MIYSGSHAPDTEKKMIVQDVGYPFSNRTNFKGTFFFGADGLYRFQLFDIPNAFKQVSVIASK